jgi:AraC-like DNA-binding protein
MRFCSLDPPYDRVRSALGVHALARDPVPGRLLVLHLRHQTPDLAAIREASTGVRTAVAWAPLVVWCEGVDPSRIMLLALKRASIGIRAVTAGDVPDLPLLRQQLTDVAELADGLPGWFAERGVDLTLRSAEAIRLLFRLGQAHRTLADFCSTVRLSERTVRGWIEAAGLGPVHDLHMIARVLPVILRLQAQPDLSVARAAFDHGLADDKALSKICRRLFDATPATARKWLGWEWLLASWWAQRRAAVQPAD